VRQKCKDQPKKSESRFQFCIQQAEVNDVLQKQLANLQAKSIKLHRKYRKYETWLNKGIYSENIPKLNGRKHNGSKGIRM
jgi:hypothetical protein